MIDFVWDEPDHRSISILANNLFEVRQNDATVLFTEIVDQQITWQTTYCME
jgi:hypothetical protein